MQTHMPVIAILVAIALPATAGPPPQVTWTTPSTDARGSMPLGNGEIALNAWVEPSGDLLFHIGRSDSWEDNSRLAKVGLVRVKLTPSLLPSGAAFSQTLDPARGEMTVTATPKSGPPTTVRVWVDANHPVAQVTIDSPAETGAAVSFEPWRSVRTTIASESSDINFGNPAGTTQVVEPDTTLTGLTAAIGWYHRNERSLGPNETMRFQDLAGAPSFTDPILHRTFGVLIKSAGAARTNDRKLTRPAASNHRFDIHVLTEHPATAAGWLAEIQARAVDGGGVNRDGNIGGNQTTWSSTGGNASMCRTEALATTHSRHPAAQTHPPPLETDMPIEVNHRSKHGFI